MSANTNPIFVLTPNIGAVSIATANANLDGTGTLGTLLAAGTYGTRVHRIKVKAAGTVTAGMVRIFIHDGSAYFLYKEVPITATTPSGTVEAFEAVIDLQNEDAIILPTGFTLYCSTENAETFKVFAEGGDY